LAYSEGIIHTVKEGEHLEAIAKRYGIGPQTIRWTNALSDDVSLKPGQELVILPVDGVLHTVRSGQTLARIAQLYEVPQEDIMRQNKLRGGLIIAGQQLIIPGGKPIMGDRAIASADSGDADTLHFGDSLSGKGMKIELHLPPAKGGGQKAIAPAAGAALTQTILQMPCEGCAITQYFNAGHFALDIAQSGGGPIYAAEGGTVIRADHGWNGGYGNVIEIDHGNGLVTLYGHNKALYVKAGDHVKRGQNVAFMGNTGLVHGPTGIHVHFEVRVNGVKKNPLLYLE
jgi:murein DD-endopeptidase MepM/ murein hydrolase activator NlpD